MDSDSNNNEDQEVINEKIQRCERFHMEFDSENQMPRCYHENSPKEELVLEHVIQFKKQFEQ